MNKTLAVVVGGRKQPAVLSHVNTTTGRKIRDYGSNFRYETCNSKATTVLCYYT